MSNFKFYYIYMSTLRYISLGHRCHIAQILKLNKLRNEGMKHFLLIV